jgi:hypothetical protein
MSWDKVKKVVGEVAPIAGTLLGGPAGAAVGSLISSVLGVDNDPESIAQALANPEAAAQLKKWYLDHELELQRLQIQQLQIEMQDVQNARAEHKNSIMPSVVTVMLTAICAGLLWSITTLTIPDESQNLAFALFGQCFTLWGACITYWVGTTRSSAEKNFLLNKKAAN